MKPIIILIALSLSACAVKETVSTTPSITSTGQDLQAAAAAATQAYIDIKGGKADFAWSVKKGLETYQLYLHTKQDVKTLVQQWSDGKTAGKTFAQRLADLFASSTGSPEEKAAVIAQGVEVAAANHSP